VLVDQFPNLSETFIALQISALSTIKGCEIEVFSFGPEGSWHFLPSGTEAALRRCSIHNMNRSVKRIAKPFRFIKIIKKYPKAFLKYLIAEKKPTKINTLVNDLCLIGDLGSFDIAYCQFATIGHNLVTYQDNGFLSESTKICCAIRGYDISVDSNRYSLQWHRMFQRIEMFLPVCSFFRAELERMGCASQIAVCPSPVNTGKLIDSAFSEDPQENSGCLKLLSIGRLVEKKGIDVALLACKELKDAGVNFEYHIIGSGPEMEKLQMLGRELGLTNQLTFHGQQPSNFVMDFYRSASLFLAPSRTARNGDSEGIPNVLKEAMLMSVPVVTSDHAGIPELVEHEVTGYVCAQNSAAAYFDLLLFAIEGRDDWGHITSLAKEKVLTDYTPEVCASKLFRNFEKLVHARK